MVAGLVIVFVDVVVLVVALVMIAMVMLIGSSLNLELNKDMLKTYLEMCCYCYCVSKNHWKGHFIFFFLTWHLSSESVPAPSAHRDGRG